MPCIDNFFPRGYNTVERRPAAARRFGAAAQGAFGGSRKRYGMGNFIFLSPNFPEGYWRFCAALKARGFCVLGIGDCPYDALRPELKGALAEYYKVNSLEDYGEVYRAVAFFAFKYGKIDWLESNNEYWLEQNARLRDDFNIQTGFHFSDMPPVKYKSKMKARYEAAGIPAARYCMADDRAKCAAFLKEAGRVVVKPDNGVGANATYCISSEAELSRFFAEGHRGYIMEEFVDGTICSYDAIIDGDGQPVFETGNVTPDSLMDVVNEHADSCFYIVKQLSEEVRRKGRAAVKAFGVKSRFVHFEFFRLNQSCHLGKQGEIVALEVNMRPSGGCSPDMMNYANGVDVYEIWADMIAGRAPALHQNEHFYCAFLGRRSGRRYALSHAEILQRYGANLKEYGEVDRALAPAMGDYRYIACFSSEEEVYAFFRALSATAAN